jgi:hypothetical protein
MNELQQWRVDLEKQVSENTTQIEALEHDYLGNGNQGFKADTTAALNVITTTLAKMEGAWYTIRLVGGIFVVVATLLLGWLAYRDALRKSEVKPPVSISTQQPPQISDGR